MKINSIKKFQKGELDGVLIYKRLEKYTPNVKNYVVIYSVDGSNMTVTVLRIFYEKSDYISKLL